LEICRRTDSGKSSPRRHLAPIDHGWLLLLACTGPAWAQAQGAPPGVAALDAFLADVRTLTADFTQQMWTADQRLLETTTGSLALQRPNQFLWRSLEPSELTVVATGEELWTYDVELEQATRTPLEDSAAASPAMLLSGDARAREQFDVVADFTRDGLDWVELTPKVDGTDFNSVRIGFRDGVLEELELVDGLNQVTQIDFTRIEVNPDLPAGTFQFVPPPGVDVLGGG
jgi:outer membrane lipoprotein carrier protein